MAGEQRLVVVQFVATKATIAMPDMSILMRLELLPDIVTFATVATPEINIMYDAILIALISFSIIHNPLEILLSFINEIDCSSTC